MEPDANLVKTIKALAETLGVSSETIRLWKLDARYAKDIPRAREDRAYYIPEWRAFMTAHGLGGYGEGKRVAASLGGIAALGESEVTGDTESDWRKRLLEQKVVREKIQNGELAGRMLVAAELEEPLGVTLLAIQNLLVAFPRRVAPRLVSNPDAHAIAAILQTETDVTQGVINAGKYLAEPASIAGLLAAMPFDEETERLLGLLTFNGEDRARLFDLIAYLVRTILTQIGLKGMAAALDRTPMPEIPDESAEP